MMRKRDKMTHNLALADLPARTRNSQQCDEIGQAGQEELRSEQNPFTILTRIMEINEKCLTDTELLDRG